jgi:predicted O-methyltransferase YrrM
VQRKSFSKSTIKKLLHRVFLLSQRFGMSVLPLHFYSSIPNMRELRGRTDWKKPRSMHGLLVRPIPDQLEMLAKLLKSIKPAAGRNLHAEAVSQNEYDGYGVIEADVLAALVASRKPKRIIQVGCGVSTAILISAAEIAGYNPEITCVDPYPTNYLKQLQAQQRITLIAKQAQTVGIETLTALGAGDLFFVDSTHTVKVGSEVNYLILEVLPRLARDVMVHFHDIYFPYDYPRDLLSGDMFFPGETTLLYAFLLNNPDFRIDLCMSMLHYAAATKLKKLILKYDPQVNNDGLTATGGQHYPSSIYLSRVG